MRRRFSMFMLLTMALTLMAPAVMAATIVVVTAANIGDEWFVVSQLEDGDYKFVEGPGDPPSGIGSLEVSAPNLLNDKVTIVTDNHDGLPIADLNALSYWTYRDGTSTSPGHTVPSINIFITNGGPDGEVSWAPLIWEPIYPFGAGAVEDDTWQEWDTMAGSQTNYGGGWWSTRTLGTICSFNCFVSWETVLEQNPHATIIVAGEDSGSFGINLGRGPSGSFIGNVDELSVTFAETTTVYDFEPLIGPPSSTNECKDGGWQTFNNPVFKNQGECVSYVASEGKAGGRR